jgi:hypothetical protein
VGVIAQADHFKMKGQSGLGGIKRMGDTGIIGLPAHQPGDQRPVGTVAFAGAGEMIRAGRYRPQSPVRPATPRQPSQTNGAGGMGTGGANHNGSDDIEQIHALTFFLFCLLKISGVCLLALFRATGKYNNRYPE